MKKKFTPCISKAEFIDVVDLIKKQYKKDNEFADFMEKYLDGRFVPVMSEFYGLAIVKALSYIFDDRVPDKYDSTWIEWFMYDNDFGEKKMQAYLNDKETEIYRANYTFMAVNAPAGKNLLTFEYKPKSFSLGLGISFFFLANWFLLVFFYFLKKLW